MADICTDNRFEVIEKYKRKLIEATNIETSPDEMKVLDSILFRFWQMGWLIDKDINVPTNDCISRQEAIDALSDYIHNVDKVIGTGHLSAEDCKDAATSVLEELPSAQEKPFNLPEIYIADGYDAVEGEDGNVGFGVYVPNENYICVAGDVEDEIRARALLHEICHWVQAVCGRPFDEDEANEFSDIVYDALQSEQPVARDTNDCISRQAAIDEAYNVVIDGETFEVVQVETLMGLPSAQPEPISEEYAKAVRKWLVNYQVKCAELRGRYTPYEVLGWIVSDWRKDNGTW